jgi:hypothetical protein
MQRSMTPFTGIVFVTMCRRAYESPCRPPLAACYYAFKLCPRSMRQLYGLWQQEGESVPDGYLGLLEAAPAFSSIWRCDVRMGTAAIATCLTVGSSPDAA